MPNYNQPLLLLLNEDGLPDKVYGPSGQPVIVVRMPSALTEQFYDIVGADTAFTEAIVGFAAPMDDYVASIAASIFQQIADAWEAQDDE